MSDLKMKGKKMGDHLDDMLKKYKRGEKIGFTALARLKARGLIPRAAVSYTHLTLPTKRIV